MPATAAPATPIERARRHGPLLALVLVSVGFGALSPALAEVQQGFQVGAGLTSLLVGGFGAGRLVAGFPAGVLVDRVGAARVILGGTLLFVAGSLIGAVAPSFAVLVVGRVLQGAGCAIVPAGVLAQLMSDAPAGRSGGAIARYQAAITVGVAIGPAVGGPLAALAGWRSALVFCAVAGLAAWAVALGFGHASARHSGAKPADRSRLGWSAALAVTLVMVPNAVASFDRFGVGLLALPLYAAGPVGLDATTIGLLLGTQTAVTLLMLGPAGWASDRFGSGRIVAVAAVLTSLGLALMPSAPGAAGLWLATLLYAVGLSTLGVAGALHIFSLPLQSTGALVGVYRLSTDAIQVVGPLLVGPVLDVVGFRVTFFGMAVFGLLALVGLLAPGPARQRA